MTGRVRYTILLPLAFAITACAGQMSPSVPQPVPSPAANTGASPSTTPSATPAEIDPCQLVTKQEAERLAGTRLNPGMRTGGESPSCTYSGPVTGPLAQVEIYVGDGAKKFLDIDRLLKHAFTALQGIGDEAYLEDGAIFLRKTDRWVAIRLVLLEDLKLSRKPLEILARTVASRL